MIATPTWPSWPVFASTMIAPQPAKTSANVPIASAASRRSDGVARRVSVGKQLGDQSFCTRASISSRIRRTVSRSCPAGSSSSQSS